jgi:Tfp pilus assembly protein PilF
MAILQRWAMAALFIGSAFGADPRWIRMPSDDFEIYSSAGEGDTRLALQYFERVRGFFEQKLGGSEQKSDPVRIIVFNSKKEYEPYRLNEFAVAYYTQVAGRDYIVLSGTSADVFPVAVHEYVHLVARHGGLNLPPWLNEGIAEIYSTLKPLGDKVEVGSLIPGRMYALSREKWVPLSAILAADSSSPYYNEKNKAGSLYNEGWALTHMLSLSLQYSPGFARAFEEIRKGTPSEQALEKVYGKPLATIEKDLRDYLAGDRFRASLFSIKLKEEKVRTTAEPASMFDVKLTLLDLSNRPGREAETRKKLEDLVAEDPKRPEPYVGLGYLAARGNQMEDARRSFKQAVDLGSKNPQMLWDYGRMAGQEDPPQSMRALSALLDQQSQRMEVRLFLSQVQLFAKQPQLAIDTLQPVRSVSPADAPRFFQLLAFAYNEVENREQALVAARRWRENSKDVADQDSADRFVQYLERPKQEARSAAPVLGSPQEAQSAPPERPSATPSPTPSPGDFVTETPAAKPVLPSVAGSFVELDCKASQPKLILQTDGGRVAFLMDDPDKLTAYGLPNAAGLSLACGPQKPVDVRIQYEPPADGQTGVKGLARAIHFEPLPGLKLR